MTERNDAEDNAHLADAFTVKRRVASREWLEAMGLADPEPSDPDAPPDFDGGVREIAPPLNTDALADHNALLTELVERDRQRRFGQ